MNHVTTLPGPKAMASANQELAQDLASGGVSGQVAGVVMLVFMMGMFQLVMHKPVTVPLQVIGSVVFGDAALRGLHVPAVITGLLIHQLGPCLFWGLVFGLVAHALDIRSGASVVVVGIGVGLLAHVLDVNILLPATFQTLHGHNIWAEQVQPFWSWMAHLVFGLGLSVFTAVHARLERLFKERTGCLNPRVSTRGPHGPTLPGP